MIRSLRYLLLFCLPILYALADDEAAVRPAPPAEYTRHLEAGKALLDSGEVDAARKELLQAVKVDESQKWAPFFLAVACYRQGDLTRAAEYGQQAYANVRDDGDPESQKIYELRHLLEAKLEAEQARQEAEQAHHSGLIAKAASRYAWAYELDSTDGESGLKAASLYVDRLDRLFDAAILWQRIVRGGEPHATAARAELAGHRDALDAALKNYLTGRTAWPMNPHLLAEAFPESMEVWVELAARNAKLHSASGAANDLGQAIRLGFTKEALMARTEFVDFAGLKDENGSGDEFREFVKDAYGSDVLDAMKATAQRRVDAAAKAAREKAEQERLAKLEQERKALIAWRNAERLTVMRSMNSLFGEHNRVVVDLVPGPKATKPKKKYPRKTIARTTALSIAGGHYLLVTGERTKSDQAPETAWDHTYHIPNFAGFLNMIVEASSWAESSDKELVAGMPHISICRSIVLLFTDTTRLSIDHAMVDPSSGQRITGTTEDSGAYARFDLMIADADIPRLKQCFAQLAKLDGAGTSLEKLRALRAGWTQ